jgi:hypothetical protein
MVNMHIKLGQETGIILKKSIKRCRAPKSVYSIDYIMLEAIRLKWPLCQVMKVVFKRSKVIIILCWIFYKRAYQAFYEAVTRLNN